MKTIYIIFITLVFAFFTSCNVTDRFPEDSITDFNYWTKVEDLRSYANNFYTTLVAPDYYDVTSDNCVSQSKDATLFNTKIVPTGDDGWSYDDWAVVRNCNYFLTHYQTVQGNERDINHYVAEVRFFRAHEYFKKLRRFGDVPWYETDLKTNDGKLLHKARDARKFVTEKIIADLEFATKNLKLASEVTAGRLHQHAAYQMLARVCLYEATWMKYRGVDGWQTFMQKAADAAQEIINSKKYEIVKSVAAYTMDDEHPLPYKQQFIQEDLTNNKECVLARIYIKNVLMHSFSRRTNESRIGISKDFIESFLCYDGLPITLSNKYKGDNSLELEITNRDPRLWNIIDNKHLPYTLNGIKPESYDFTPIEPIKCPTGYMASKFRHPEPAQNEANQSTYDWYVFRYAEVLLILAEAKAELGTIIQDDLDNTINKLRERLDIDNQPMGRLSLNPPFDPLSIVNGKPRYGYTISTLLYEIRRERRIELAFEGFRWDDICRWKAGVLIENPKTMCGIAVNNDVITNYTNYFGGTNPFKDRATWQVADWDGNKELLKVYDVNSRLWDDKLYLDPLPKNQLNLNSSLEQNQGWPKN